MAAAGEGPSSGYGGNGGGAGGKFRKRPFRRVAHATPYDRPPAPGNPSWLSKIVVEPASRLIASSAQRFFASVFRKRLPPPPPPPEVHQVLSHERPEVVERAEVQEAALHVNTNPASNDVSDLERVFKKKTFTRSEIDHLTELLQSRAEDGPRKSEIRTEADHEKLVANSERQQWYLSSPLAGKSTPYDSSPGLNATPASSTRVLEEDIASPAEIAKAYMGNQASRISPSMLGLRTRAVREEANLLRNVPYTPKSSVTPMSTKGPMSTKRSHGEGPGNGFVTPRSLGRSAIYSMARTPYSRVHPTAFQKGSGSRSGFGGPLPALNEQHGELGNRTALKRRSSVLDDDLGSMGPMRRTRQKPSMLSYNTLHQGVGSSSARQHTLMNERAQRSSKLGGENDDLQTSRTSFGHVPPHSTRMAEKIFEHIEYMASKPKSKSPAKLTTNMLRGQALKSLEDADSSKLLYNNLVHNSSGSPSKRRVSPKEKDRTEEIISQKLDSQDDVSTPRNGDTKTLVTGTSTSAEASCSVAKADGQHPPKKQGFKMNFDEDLDDDTSYDGPTFELLPSVNSNQDKQNSVAVEKSFPDNRMPLESVSGKRLDLESVDSGKAVGLSFTAPPSSLEFDSTKQASNKFLGSDPVSNPAGQEPWSYMLPNPDRIVPESVKGRENGVAEASKTNGKMDNSPLSVSSNSTSTSGILSSFSIPAQHQPAAIPSFLSAPASTGITNSFLTNGTSNIASSSSASSSSATTLFSAASASATLLSTEATVSPKTTIITESAGNSSISALNAEVHDPKTSSAENSSSTAFARSGFFGLSKPSTAASHGKDSLSSSNGGSLPNAHTSLAGSGAGSVSSLAQVQFAPSYAFGSPAVASVSSSPSLSLPSLSETKQLSSSSVANPGIFSFSAKDPSSETNVISSNSNSSPFGTTASATYATGSSNLASTAISSAATAAVTNAIGSITPVFTSFSGNSSAGNMVSSNSAGAGGFSTTPFTSTGFSYGTNSAPAFGSSSFDNATPAFGSSPSSFQTTISAPVFGSSGSFQSTISAPVLGSSSGSFPSTSNAPSLFGPSSGSFPSISKTPGFGSSASSSQSPIGVQQGFGVTATSFTAPAVNNDQMQEETMAEDTVNSSVYSQQPTPSPSPVGYSFLTQPANPFPFTGQQSQAAPQNQFVFSGQAAPQNANPFQATPQNANPFQATPQNANPFQASGSLELNAGGSFSMGSSGLGGDKSGRKNFKAKRLTRKK